MRIRRWLVLLLLGMLALPALAAPQFGIAPIAQAASVSTCDQYGTWNVTPTSKTYVVQNNRWGASTQQCIAGDNANTSWRVSTSQHNMPTNGHPAGYPSIFKGCHWGNCTNSSGMPRQYSAMSSVPSSWSISVPTTGSWNAAYDIWFNKSSSSSGQNDGAEIMIWLNSRNVQPAGTRVASGVSIAGAQWDVWHTTMSGSGVTWNYVGYKRTSPTNSVNFDLKAFFNDARNRGYIQSTWWLTSVQAGFELWAGGVGLQTNSFSVTVN